MGLSLPYGATWVDEGVVKHVLEVKVFYCEVGNPITELDMTSRDEAALLSV